MIDNRKKHKSLSYVLVLTVARKCEPQVRCAAIEAFNQARCCAAQAFWYKLKQLFDYTSYFVTVGLCNTRYGAAAAVERLFRDVETPGASFVLSSSALLSLLLLLFCFLSLCNEDVLINLRVSSLTESDLYKNAVECLLQ